MAAALSMMVSAPLQAGVEVTSAGDRLDVVAAQAPLSEVLDGLARKTRMKVVYEGPAPVTLVTVELRGRTPAEAVLGVLEGLGLNYALALDASGTEVQTLMIVSGGAPMASASAASVRPARPGRRGAPHATPDDPVVESEEPVEVEAGIAPPVAPEVAKEEAAKPKPSPPPGPLNPAGAFPVSPFAPGPSPWAPTPSPSPRQQ